MSDTPTLTDIAAAIRRHSPKALPVLGEEDGRLCMIESSGRGEYAANWHVPLPDDIARHVLMAAMVLDAKADRFAPCDDGWIVHRRRTDVPSDTTHESKAFFDVDHGGSLGACYAAWRFAKGIA